MNNISNASLTLKNSASKALRSIVKLRRYNPRQIVNSGKRKLIKTGERSLVCIVRRENKEPVNNAVSIS